MNGGDDGNSFGSGRGGGVLRRARDERKKGGRRSVWTAELGEAFLDALRVSGDAQAAARAVGVAAHVFHKRIRRDGDLRRRYREAAAAGGRPRPVKRASARWSPALGERFLAIVRETGNARQAAIRLGAPNAFSKRMRVDPAFRRRALAAAAEADARWRGAVSPFPDRIEYKGRRLPTDADALGGMLRPGRKKAGPPEPVLRRNSQGRMQVTLTREGHWTSEIEADFLALLRATGNFDASALAVGFQPASVHERERKWAAFARDCERALAEADVTLTYKLTAHAHALMRKPGEAEAAGIEEEEAPFDPAMAMKILSHIDARKYGRSGKGRRKGPPERSFEQACRSILAKIEAIERHEKASRESGAFMGTLRRDDGGSDGA